MTRNMQEDPLYAKSQLDPTSNGNGSQAKALEMVEQKPP